MLKLYIGNKNYSSWSMRPWVLLRQAGIPFEEVMVRFDAFDPGSMFKSTVASVTPVGKVPVLVDGDLAIWDTLARSPSTWQSGTRWPSPSTWPNAFPSARSGRQTPVGGRARAASAPRCTPALARCVATVR